MMSDREAIAGFWHNVVYLILAEESDSLAESWFPHLHSLPKLVVQRSFNLFIVLNE